MRKGLLLLLFSACLLFLSFPLSAQDDFAVFQRGAGGSSLLFRGHQAFAYDLLYNGTYWWTAPEFQPGRVAYNSKAYRDVSLNIDAVRQELVIRTPAGMNGKVLDSRYVDSCVIGNTKFLNLRTLYGPDAPGGYWQVLYDGKRKFLKQVTKHLEQDLDGSKRGQTGSSLEYKEKVINVFIYKSFYGCLLETGQFVPVRRKRQLNQLFKSQKRDIRHYMNRREAGGSLDLEHYGPELLQFLESR